MFIVNMGVQISLASWFQFFWIMALCLSHGSEGHLFFLESFNTLSPVGLHTVCVYPVCAIIGSSYALLNSGLTIFDPNNFGNYFGEKMAFSPKSSSFQATCSSCVIEEVLTLLLFFKWLRIISSQEWKKLQGWIFRISNKIKSKVITLRKEMK